jgi:hypothetical protein
MARICSNCSYYDAEGDQPACPQCGGALQFTMLGPPSGAPEEEAPTEKPAWSRPEEFEAEILEQPLAVRLAQISAGIGFYFVVRWMAAMVLAVSFAELLFHSDPNVAAVTLGAILIAVYAVAALVAGAIAGAWTVNWVPQGIGVGAGLFVIPLVLLLFTSPESLVFYLIVVFLTTVFTVVGAYLGHVLVKPSRVIQC